MNPWLQRLLISLAAGATASGLVVGTAKAPHKLKKRKKKRKKDGTPIDDPVKLGALALHDAKMPPDHGLTVAEWKDAVVARGSSVASIFKRKPKDDGAIAPDVIESRDGTRVKPKKPGGKRKRARRGKRRPRATLWDSAKESFKQTVKETVREEVKQSPVGGALDALKNVGNRVKEGATAVAASAQKAAREAKLDEKLADAKTALDAAIETVRNRPDAPPAITSTHSDEPEAAPLVRVDAPAPTESAPAVDDDVGRKVKSGLDAVGSWLEGPGSPRYGKRVRPAGSGDVVDAVDPKDPPVVEPKPAAEAKPDGASDDHADDDDPADERAAE